MAHIPRGALLDVAQVYLTLLRRLNERPGWESLHALWAFPKSVLAPMQRSGRAHWAALGRVISARARAYLNQQVSVAWASSAPRQTSRTKPVTRRTAAREQQVTEERFVGRIASLVGSGAISKACQHLLSDGIQDAMDPAVARRLRELHPLEPEPGRFPETTKERLHFSSDDEERKERLERLKKAIFSFPKESAAGPSGLRPDHMKEMLGEYPGSSGELLLDALDEYVCTCLRGEVHRAVAPILCAARLTPLRKLKHSEEEVDAFGNLVPTGRPTEEGTRPIAAGEFLRRLVGKMLMKEVELRRAVRRLHPPQVGVGVPSACSTVAMGLQQVVNSLDKERREDWAVLQVDFANAFNSVSRKDLLQAVKERCPVALPWFEVFSTLATLLPRGDDSKRAGAPARGPLWPSRVLLGCPGHM